MLNENESGKLSQGSGSGLQFRFNSEEIFNTGAFSRKGKTVEKLGKGTFKKWNGTTLVWFDKDENSSFSFLFENLKKKDSSPLVFLRKKSFSKK